MASPLTDRAYAEVGALAFLLCLFGLVLAVSRAPVAPSTALPEPVPSATATRTVTAAPSAVPASSPSPALERGGRLPFNGGGRTERADEGMPESWRAMRLDESEPLFDCRTDEQPSCADLSAAFYSIPDYSCVVYPDQSGVCRTFDSGDRRAVLYSPSRGTFTDRNTGETIHKPQRNETFGKPSDEEETEEK